MKWEYKVIKLFSISHIKQDEIQEDAIRANSETLAKFGREGWELVSVDNGIAYFKRPAHQSARLVPNPLKVGEYTMVGGDD